MLGLVLKPEITIGDIFTGFSIIVSIIIFIVTNWISSQKDRQLSRKAYADTIRRAAGTITAKLERWGNLGLRFFEDIQPVLVDTDSMLVQKQEFVQPRDFLWRSLVDKHGMSSQRIVDEQIEMAYSDLYGYDPRIQELFTTVVDKLQNTDERCFRQLLLHTQDDISTIYWDSKERKKPITTTELGNALRRTCGVFAADYEREMRRIVEPFRSDMIKLINTKDDEIFDRKIQLSPLQEYQKVWEQSIQEPWKPPSRSFIELKPLTPDLIGEYQKRKQGMRDISP